MKPRVIQFTPLQGLMNVGEKLAHAFGLGELWAGDDGFEGVCRQKLTEMGVPVAPIPLNGPTKTPRQLAEESGFIKKRKPHRRVR